MNTPTIDTGPDALDRLAELASRITPLIAASLPDNRTGGYLYFCDAEGRQLLHKMLGEPDPAKWAKYREYSREKADRLLRHPEHVLSAQSRNPDEKQYGGALRLASGHILSFSGFSEIDDQHICGLLAEMMSWNAEQSYAWQVLTDENERGDFLDMWRIAA